MTARLPREQHQQVARLLNEAVDLIAQASHIACHARGARYTDASLKVQRDIRQKLIDPLRCELPDPMVDDPYAAERQKRDRAELRAMFPQRDLADTSS